MPKNLIEIHSVSDDGHRHLASFDAESIRSRHGMQSVINAAHKQGREIVFIAQGDNDAETTAKKPASLVVDVWDTSLCDDLIGAHAAAVSLDSGDAEWVLAALKEDIAGVGLLRRDTEDGQFPCVNIGPDEDDEEQYAELPAPIPESEVEAGMKHIAAPHTISESDIISFDEASEIQNTFNGEHLENPSQGMRR